MSLIGLLCAATQQFYVVGGQHRFEACRRFREKQLELRRSVPEWAVKFKCKVLKAGLSKDTVEIISGRLQAQSSTLMNMSVATTLRFFHNKYLECEGSLSMSDLLKLTYDKTGKRVTEGTPVCISICLAGLLSACFALFS